LGQFILVELVNNIIILDNKTCQFSTDDSDLLRILRSTLSYKMTGVEYTEAYKAGWNGITYLVSKKGIFFYGLLNKVKKFLKEHNQEFHIKDLRPAIVSNVPIDLSESLKKLNMIPRDYQERIINCACQNNNGIIRACTGSGKTLSIALITAKLNKPTIVYVIGLDLLKQFHDLFSSLFNESIGYIGNGICNIERINIASVWTIGKSLNIKDICLDDEFDHEEKFDTSQTYKILHLLQKTKVHFFDECHICTCNTIQSIYKKINPEYIYGFSGTPYRDDNTDLLINGILGEQIIDIPASELIEKKILAQPIIKYISIPPISMPLAQYQTVYKTYITNNIIRNTIIVKQTKELLEKKYTPLVLFKQIKHGKILFDMMKEENIKCEMLYGDDSLDRRTEVKKMLLNKEINVILASTIFDLGVDIPMLSALILCGAGKSSVKALQRIGRLLRSFPGKQHVAIVDFYDQIKFLKKHSIIRYNIYSSERGFKVFKCKDMK
jgi:superfamily II DNA or RNA helicase